MTIVGWFEIWVVSFSSPESSDDFRRRRLESKVGGEPRHCSDDGSGSCAPRPVKFCFGSCALRRVSPACCVIRADPPMPSAASG
jgi:hypothetical protein